MTAEFYIAIAIFVAAYALISSERVHRTKVSVAGALLMVIFGVVTQKQAIWAIDFDTIFLLMGMMIIVNVTRESGFFEFVAIKGVRMAGGNPWRLLVIFSILTAIVSAFLDNVTTVLLFAPIVLFVADTLGSFPLPYLVAVIFSANIGGAATLIGAPPNIMIGSATGYSFLDFIIHLFPIAVIAMAANIGLLWLLFKNKMHAARIEEGMKLDPSKAIKDKKLLVRSLIVLGLTILGFILHNLLNLEPATVALSGAALMLLIIPGNPIGYLEKIEWNTLFFFAGLFVLVGGLEAAGIIERVFRWLSGLTENASVLSMIFLWVSSVACSFIDNIPFTAMMIPLVSKISGHLAAGQTVGAMPLWWGLALGVNFGGNGTIIAASPNVVVSGIAEQSKNKISFKQYFGYGMLSVLLSAALSSVYIWIRYL